MEEYTYNVSEKDKCWYKKICDCKRCGDEFCIRHYKMDCLVSMAGLEGNQRYPITLVLDKDKIDKDAFIQLREIQQDINNFVLLGKNLFIYSKNTGNGKTEWTKKLLLSWFDSIWATTELECRGLFVSMPRLLAGLKNNINKTDSYYQYINEHILTADLVVWDELNFKDMTNFEHDYVFNCIDQRIAVGKSNIFTTNFSIDVTADKLGARLSSRILGKSIKVELKGKDKRGLEVK